jgi:hypothetical protein
MTWKEELGEAFPSIEGLLRSSRAVDSMLDRDYSGRILDLEEREDGDFNAFSREIPAHRSPFKIERAEVVRLIPEITAISAVLSRKLGFISHGAAPARTGNFHELGSLHLPRQQPRPVFLFLPSARPRPIALQEGLLGIESAVVLLPTNKGMSFELRQIASARDIDLRILDFDKELSIAPAVRGDKRSPDRPPLITPLPGWEWKHLTLIFESEGLRARIHGTERFATWKELGIRPLNRGKIQGPLQILIPLANGKRISQRRNDENGRQQISRARKLLRQLVPLHGDPFHKFKDGYGIVFHVEIPEARKKARAQETSEEATENELTERTSQLDEGDLNGFSIHSF